MSFLKKRDRTDFYDVVEKASKRMRSDAGMELFKGEIDILLDIISEKHRKDIDMINEKHRKEMEKLRLEIDELKSIHENEIRRQETKFHEISAHSELLSVLNDARLETICSLTSLKNTRV